MDQSLPNDLIVPAALPYGDTRGARIIKFCREKIRVKYEATHESFEYDSYIAARAAADPSWHNRIEREDAEKTRLINSHFKDEEIDDLMWRAEMIGKALQQIPDDLILDAEVSDEVYQRIASVFRDFIRPYVRLPKATKVLHMKRPWLIPMLDSYVLSFLFSEDREYDAATGVLGMRQFRALMLHGSNLEALYAIAEETNRWLTGLTREGPPPILSPVRVLDHLLWFDGGGYKWFKWVCDGGVVRPR